MDQKRTKTITGGRLAAGTYHSGPGSPSGKSGNGVSKPGPKAKGSKRISASLVALSSAAIVAIYGFGYVQTQASADQLAVPTASSSPESQVTSAPAPTPNAASGVLPTDPPTVVVRPTTVPPTPAASPTTIPAKSSAAAVARPTATSVPPTPVPTPTVVTQKYKDGTYIGQGWSRHGGVVAAVVIKGGKIVSANVQSCSTRYPCSVVDQLPGLVVQTQAPPVDYVSGATDSSMAYQQAVTSALAQAQGQGNG
ncbi:MAG TPA: hypothetical protein VKX96_10880 [Chloroflexota bacterium]|nr:hypothetical protein [Chloroflexota bacterium]